MRGRKPNTFRYGLVAVMIVVAATYLGFTKDIPFTRPFEIDAVFESANSIRKGSPVRIAGVNVGKVVSVTHIGDLDAANVRISITDEGQPIHADARAKIRPRIFLEGNFFVDLTPGSPGAPVLEDGDDIPITNTSTPVQIDEVLTALQDPEREDLRTILDELGTGLEVGAKSFNRAYEDIAPAERDTSIVNEAFSGTDPERDLPRLIEGLARATEGLGRNEDQLQDLVTDFATTMGAFSENRDALEDTIRELGPTLETTNVALAQINGALPPLRGFALDLVPGVRETPATIEAGFPWIDETRRLLAQDELRGLARDLAPGARDTAALVRASLELLPEANAFARCVSDTLVPAGDQVIRDDFETGKSNYQEFLYALVGFAGEGASFDGNGSFVRFQPGGGAETVALGPPSADPLLANVFPGTRTQPKMPASKPPVVGTVPCASSSLPDVNGPAAATAPFGRPAATSTATPTPEATATATASATATPTATP